MSSPIALSYSSPPLKPCWLARRFPSLFFYQKIVRIVTRSAIKAKWGHYDDHAWFMANRENTAALEAVGVHVSVENAEVFRRLNGPAVILGNHMSTAETFILGGFILPAQRVTFVVKRSLVDYPIFGHIMRNRNPVVVGRTNAKDDLKTVLDEGAKRLADGLCLIVFPQRTRTTLFSPDDFNSIGVKLAKRAGVPVIPLAVKTDAWGNGKRLKDFGPITPSKPLHIAFGEPLTITGTGKEENQAVIDFIQERLAAWERADKEHRPT